MEIRNMEKDYLNVIRELVIGELKNEEVSIALFGSFATGNNNESSDVDIAIIPKGKSNRYKLTSLREKLEELTIPYIVEIIDFSTVSASFRETALENAIWWKL
jgi:predicted nucleotidyltransferase